MDPIYNIKEGGGAGGGGGGGKLRFIQLHESSHGDQVRVDDTLSGVCSNQNWSTLKGEKGADSLLFGVDPFQTGLGMQESQQEVSHKRV